MESIKKTSLLAHFIALRQVFIVCTVSVAVAFVTIYYFFINFILNFLSAPIRARGIKIIYTAISEAVTTQLKVSFVAAIIVASPIIIGSIWWFVRPGLYKREKRTVVFWFFVTVMLFLSGVAFCYFCIYKLAINFFIVSGEEIAVPMISIDKYMSFLLSFLVPFGVTFTLPVIIYVTTKLGITTPHMLIHNFKYVVLVIFTVAAILTPPDVFSQIMLALPMIGLYCIGIVVAKVVKKKEANNTAVP